MAVRALSGKGFALSLSATESATAEHVMRSCLADIAQLSSSTSSSSSSSSSRCLFWTELSCSDRAEDVESGVTTTLMDVERFLTAAHAALPADSLVMVMTQGDLLRLRQLAAKKQR